MYPRPAACVVYAPPMPNLKGRNIALRNILDLPDNPRERMPVLNRYISYASRLVVDPRLARSKVGTWLLTETIPLVKKPIVESLSPVDFSIDFCNACGFEQLMIPPPIYHNRIRHYLLRMGISDELHIHPELVHKRIESLMDPIRSEMLYELQRFVNHYSHQAGKPHSLERTTWILTKLLYPSVYHFWIDPIWMKTSKKTRYRINDEKKRCNRIIKFGF